MFTYTVTDAHGATSTVDADHHHHRHQRRAGGGRRHQRRRRGHEAGVNPGNTAFAGDPSATGNVLTNDTDVDAGDTKTVSDGQRRGRQCRHRRSPAPTAR